MAKRMLAIAALFVCDLGASPVDAQSPAAESAYVVPRTSFGHPSFEGVWTTNFVLPMEASPEAPMLTLPEAEAEVMAAKVANGISEFFGSQLDPEVPALMANMEGLAIVRGQRRTRAVVEPADGMIPYTPAARKEVSAPPPDQPMDNHEERDNWERCLRGMGLAPVATVDSFNPRQFVQTANAFLFHTEYGGEVRIIPYADKHRPKMFHSKLGDSIAHWEGDTLVIETVGMHEGDRYRFFPTILVSAEAKVIERLTRLSKDELLYQYTVIDPKVYAAPWLAEMSLYRTDQRMFEHACHEGNYSLPNILKGQRIADARVPKAAAPKRPRPN